MRGNDLRGRGVNSAVTLNGKTVPLCFCFLTFSLAEEIYNDVFNRQGDIVIIINDLTIGGTAALLSLGYGAAAAANENLSFDSFVEMANNNENKIILHEVLIKNLNRMFRDTTGADDAEADANETNGFPWDVYYRVALSIGMTEQEFWNATPRKIWLLTRDKEEEEMSEWLTDNYV